ncbi:MAG: nucleotidyltransferase [Peptococcia bacterium]|jgi:predicted nucleotidyltransferase
MNVIGIIAEYNPFHNGHLYHLQTAKKRTAAEGVICVLSGNFLQRGEPALTNKWARAKMAIQNGVDLVFELPVLYATHSAYWFARGGIETLAHTGIVSHLAFGVETVNPTLFQKAATFLAEEPPSYQQRLQELLQTGLSFPQARIQALPPELSCHSQILQSPNNILALTYLQILQEQNLSLSPVMIKRQGADYLDKTLSPNSFPSATAIRNHLTQSPTKFLTLLQDVTSYLPPATLEILQEEYTRGQTPIFLNQLTPQLMTLLRRTTKKELQQIVDISEGLENRILQTAHQVTNLQDFLTHLKTKRFTYTRLQRFLIHLFINYTKEQERCLQNGPPYLRLLGFSPHGQELLKKIKKKSSLPLITKGAHLHKYLHNNPTVRCFWDMDVRATNLYTLLYPNFTARKGNLDYLQKPIF